MKKIVVMAALSVALVSCNKKEETIAKSESKIDLCVFWR